MRPQLRAIVHSTQGRGNTARVTFTCQVTNRGNAPFSGEVHLRLDSDGVPVPGGVDGAGVPVLVPAGQTVDVVRTAVATSSSPPGTIQATGQLVDSVGNVLDSIQSTGTDLGTIEQPVEQVFFDLTWGFATEQNGFRFSATGTVEVNAGPGGLQHTVFFELRRNGTWPGLNVWDYRSFPQGFTSLIIPAGYVVDWPGDVDIFLPFTETSGTWTGWMVVATPDWNPGFATVAETQHPNSVVL